MEMQETENGELEIISVTEMHCVSVEETYGQWENSVLHVLQ